MITLVAARASDGAIGRDGSIPWDAPEDLKAFATETSGGALIMGRRTWESLPNRPLPRRLNCVVTRGAADGADLVCRSVDDAVRACAASGRRRIYGIGGASIYAALLPYAHRLVLTEVALKVPDADTHFPAFDAADWIEIGSTRLRSEAPACVLRELLRRDPAVAVGAEK